MSVKLSPPRPTIISPPVLAAVAAWGARVRQNGNRKDVRAQFWVLTTFPTPSAMADGIPAISELRDREQAQGLDQWADDGGAGDSLHRTAPSPAALLSRAA